MFAATLLALLIAAPARAQEIIGTPGASGDQLIFFYDATANRTPFLVVSNLSTNDLTLEVAWYSQDASQRLATQFEVLAAGGNRVFDPSQVEGVDGNVGLAVVTPVRSAADPTPIVAPLDASDASGPLFGGYTLADLTTNSAFGQNPLARLAVDATGNRASAGAVVDGAAVRYQRCAPDGVVLPFYFDPTTAGFTTPHPRRLRGQLHRGRLQHRAREQGPRVHLRRCGGRAGRLGDRHGERDLLEPRPRARSFEPRRPRPRHCRRVRSLDRLRHVHVLSAASDSWRRGVTNEARWQLLLHHQRRDHERTCHHDRDPGGTAVGDDPPLEAEVLARYVRADADRGRRF